MMHLKGSFGHNKPLFLSFALIFLSVFSVWGRTVITADTGIFVNRVSVYNAAGHDKLDISSGGFQVTYFMGEELWGALIQGSFLLPAEETLTLVGADEPVKTNIDLTTGIGGFDLVFGPAIDYTLGPLHIMGGIGGHLNLILRGWNYIWGLGLAATGYIYAPILPFFSLNIGFNLAIDFFGDISYRNFEHIFFRGYMAGFTAGIGFQF